MSLARRCLLLFGAAVLISIFAALILPGMRMHDLTQERHLRIAKEVSAIIATNLANHSLADAKAKLDRDWPRLRLMGENEFPSEPPSLYGVEEIRGRAAMGAKGFLTEAMAELEANPGQLYKFKIDDADDGSAEVRLAMAFRAPQTAPKPNELIGVVHVRVPIHPVAQFENYAALAAALSCGAILAMLVFYLVTQRLLLSPVRKLRRLAEQVTTGDIHARAKIETGDEFEELGDAFNDMLGHLHTTQEELRKTNRSLDTRLGELAQTNVALFESNKLKSEFIANVSHELRTPLVSIIGFAELLVESGDSPKTRERILRYSNNILTSGRMLLEIINDLLDLAKIEAGKLELHIVECDVEQLCGALIDFLTPLADKKRINLSLECADATIMHTDAGRLKQILYNLLSNAVKFTPEEGSVQLEVASRAGDMVAFAVHDTGPGIPPDRVEIIFEKFRQIDSSHTREYEGTGLGLAITRELATLLGGNVSLESRPGEGCTFTVTLPVNAPTEPIPSLINLTG